MLSSMPCDGEALSKRIGYADVAFALRQTVRTDLEANRQLATLAELIIRCSLVSLQVGKAKAAWTGARAQTACRRPSLCSKEGLWLWWRGRDLNPRPLGYEKSAPRLTWSQA